MNPDHKKEILFYYESDHANPNGDPGFENMPRLVQDGTILVTDVRIKRTIRDHAKKILPNEILFVERKKEGEAIMADERVEELGIEIKKDNDIIKALLEKTFDVPLFGALVTIRKKNNDQSKKKSNKNKNLTDLSTDDPDEGETKQSQISGSAKLTGPVQFGIGRSVNQPEILTPSITSAFQGAETRTESTYGSIGKFSIVDYALIKIHGAINPTNLGDYYNNPQIIEKFKEKESKLFQCLWDGTNELITRSKWRQRSILFLEVTYCSSIYNDLATLVVENDNVKGRNVKKLPDAGKKSIEETESIYDFSKFIDAIKSRKEKIVEIRVRGCEEIKKTEINNLKKKIEDIGVKIVEI